MERDLELYLRPTAIIDSDHPEVQEFAGSLAAQGDTAVQTAVRLYVAVRDGIWYDPYSPFHLPEHYRPSFVLRRKRSFCVPKASLLCALGRSCGIPTRVGFATVRNHLATRRLLEYLGSDLFVYHAFVEFFLEGKWVKAAPAFNRELCQRRGVPPLEFNGREDSLFHAYDMEKRKYMEYVDYHGTYADIPVETIVAAWKRAYGEERVHRWIEQFSREELAGQKSRAS